MRPRKWNRGRKSRRYDTTITKKGCVACAANSVPIDRANQFSAVPINESDSEYMRTSHLALLQAACMHALVRKGETEASVLFVSSNLQISQRLKQKRKHCLVCPHHTDPISYLLRLIIRAAQLRPMQPASQPDRPLTLDEAVPSLPAKTYVEIAKRKNTTSFT